MDSGTKPEITTENKEVDTENVSTSFESVSNDVADKGKQAKPKGKKVIIVAAILIVILAIIFIFIILWQHNKTNKTSNQTQATTGINNPAQLKAARDKLTSIVQPITSSTKKLQSIK